MGTPRMRISAWIVTTLIFVSTMSSAWGNQYESEIYSLGISGDTRALSEMLARHQDAFLKGQISADDMRRLMRPLQRTHPGLVHNLKSWVESEPDNPMAHIALSWNIYVRAFQVRGYDTSYNTHREASNHFRKMIRRAADHAQLAYQLDENLIPASDAMIRMHTYAKYIRHPNYVLQKVMETHPNWGTLSRALFLSHPGWGGHPDRITELCSKYVDLLPPEGDIDLETRCYVEGYASYYWKDVEGWLDDLRFDITSDPVLDWIRADLILSRSTSRTVTDDELNFAREHILKMKNPLAAMRKARQWDKIAPRTAASGPYFNEQIAAAHYENALQNLETDPLNLSLIQFLQEAENPLQLAPGETNEDRAAAQALLQLKLAERKIVASPFRGQNWLDYVWPLKATGADFSELNKAYVNAIAYSSDPPKMLAFYLSELDNRISHLRASIRTTSPSTLSDHGSSAPPLISKGQETGLFCQYLRAFRLFEIECNASIEGEAICKRQSGFANSYERYKGLAQKVAQRPRCSDILLLSVGELEFEPQGVNLTALE